MIKCEDCSYFWADCDKSGKPINHPSCHYGWNDGYAPCEVDDIETPDDYCED